MLVSILLAMGGVYYGWANKISSAELNDVRINIQNLNDDMDRNNNIDVNQAFSISDIKTEITDRLARIETLVSEINKRIK